MYHNRLSMQDSCSLDSIMLLTWSTKRKGGGRGGVDEGGIGGGEI